MASIRGPGSAGRSFRTGSRGNLKGTTGAGHRSPKIKGPGAPKGIAAHVPVITPSDTPKGDSPPKLEARPLPPV